MGCMCLAMKQSGINQSLFNRSVHSEHEIEELMNDMKDTTILMPEPVIGMLAWEGGGKHSLTQLEAVPGNIVHPNTFSYPIKLRRIEGANYRTVVEKPCEEVLARMIVAAKEMEAAGIKAITTTCGFNAIFQKKLANSVAVPVFTSSLMQIPLVCGMLAQGQELGVITADKNHLTRAHLEQVGIASSVPLCIAGMENTGEFSRVRTNPLSELNVEKFIEEIFDVAKMLSSRHPNLGAIVLECTDLPPASATIRKRLGMPVFDIVTLMNMVHEAVSGPGWTS